jgi:alpha-L-glutamate ligase-like protein
MRWASPGRLRRGGIVGMNMRNVSYIAHHNPRHLYPRVDDKVLTKKLALAAGIHVPKLYGIVQFTSQLKDLPDFLRQYDRFVVKPSRGSAGKGIVVITGRSGENLVKASGSEMSMADLRHHINNTLSGLYSLGGRADKAMIEYCVEFTRDLDAFSYQGVPDIRVIVFKGFPVMAMMRMPTSDSDGKANLHQGAIGAGIDLTSGKACGGVQFTRPIDHHPDTQMKLAELHVPRWKELLELASRCYEVTELGYMGADIVLDQNLGPLILELNARPGLSIQVANRKGLMPRMEAIEGLGRRADKMGPEERVDFVQKHFGI